MSLIDDIPVDETIRKDVMDARVVRGMFQCSDHYAVKARIRVRAKWEYGRKNRGGNKREVASGRLNDNEYREVYKRRVGEVLEDARLSMGEGVGVNDVYEVFKTIVMGTAAEVMGYKTQKKCKKGSAWWSEEVKDAVEKKRKAYRRTLQMNVSEEVKERWKREYNVCKRQVKKMVSESKRRVDEEFGKKLSEKFKENKKLFWKEVKRERGEGKSGSVRIKREDGVTVSGSEEVKEVWKRHFDSLINGGTGGVVTCMGMEAGGRRQDVQGELGREGVRKAIGKLKMGKAPGVDGITAEMLKCGGEVVVEWMLQLCTLAWRQEEVPEDCRRAIIVSLYKGKGSKEECGSYRGIYLLSEPGKVYEKVLTERLIEVTGKKVSEEQGWFRKGRRCVDQIFALKSILEKYIGKGRKLYAAFMDLKKAYDRVDRKAMTEVLKIYSVGGSLLKGFEAFYAGAKACVWVEGDLSESFNISVELRQGCVMSPWLFNIYIYGWLYERDESQSKWSVGEVEAE
ncbi:hypothetical protein Pcinc_006166 [Petrolisthes cinctipes]|uniref:Reverse transcriptase domain-containing protein n=1 Tax=Petrolisthes cinctipes TaxID=88211 RepID=A0AAE1L1T7_PETCI|nr:hypothetical protein Pcinc_006166 [Petrolisthes cinctipes]